MPIEASRPRGTASDPLMSQVSVDNVLAVHRLLENQAQSIQTALTEAAWMNDIPRCANDPISVDAKTVFQPKISEILRVHTAHFNEVREAADRLREAALQYGYTDIDVEQVMQGGAEQRPRDRPIVDR